jgi:hypothetical protein
LNAYDAFLDGEIMNSFKKLEHRLAALAMAPLIVVETNEREKRLKERLQRSKPRH